MKSASGYPIDRGVVSSLLLACLLLPVALPQQSAVSSRLYDEDDIREAVLRKQMWDWIKGSDESLAKAKDASEKALAKELNFQIFFVSVNGKDPTDDFIKRFRTIPRTVKKASSSATREWRNTVVDQPTGRRGIIFMVGEIRWLSKDSAQADGGYFCDGLCGIGETFSLRREDGKWIVRSVRVHWIS